MSSRQLRSKGESDGLSLPGKKSSNQPEMEQQQQDQLQQRPTVQISPLPDQPPRLASAQLTAGESAAPTAGQADRPSSTPLQDTGLMQLPPASTMPPARAGTPQVFFNNNTKIQVHTCLKCLVLYLQKIYTAPAVAVTKRYVTKKLETSPELAHHLKHLQL